MLTASVAGTHAPREPVGGSQCCTQTAASTWPKLIAGTATLSRASWSTACVQGSRRVDAKSGRSAPRKRGVRGGNRLSLF